MVVEGSSEHRQWLSRAPCLLLCSVIVIRAANADLSLKDPQVSSLTVHETDFRMRGTPKAVSCTLLAPWWALLVPPTPKPSFPPALPPPTWLWFFSDLRSPEGEAFFVESAILISHTELLGFFSLVREEGS